MKSSLFQIAAGLVAGVVIVSAFLVVSNPVSASAASPTGRAAALQQQAAGQYASPGGVTPGKPGVTTVPRGPQSIPVPPGGYDRHWSYDSDQAIPGWSCYPGAPMDCFGRRPFWFLSINAQNVGTLNASIRELQALSNSLGTAQAGLISINSQLILVKLRHADRPDRKGKGADQLTMAEAVEALRIDTASLAYPMRPGAPVSGGPRICWAADGSGRVYRRAGKNACLFPARLIQCLGPTATHDEQLRGITMRMNQVLAKAAASNRDPSQELAIFFVAGRPVLCFVQREGAPANVAATPESPFDAIRKVLRLDG